MCSQVTLGWMLHCASTRGSQSKSDLHFSFAGSHLFQSSFFPAIPYVLSVLPSRQVSDIPHTFCKKLLQNSPPQFPLVLLHLVRNRMFRQKYARNERGIWTEGSLIHQSASPRGYKVHYSHCRSFPKNEHLPLD